ncbi:FAD-linked oxidoreductase-like protein [Thamnocephalis sphaerospora]|uniref:Proline dehydrogenase n=1 Tax=Thamnocephalis sphaerospora TaxID=78915 RepID=A0A4P9XJM8_9FUNG|nr:FAD-linked oxidoreductase-like protein [Thamnocephalis sphaerospora]|eukprot:RKP05977.1 FAD-linked oxidoreductase-like protein [Thamnocephalis sphaerospora]
MTSWLLYSALGAGVASVLVDPDPLFPTRPTTEAEGAVSEQRLAGTLLSRANADGLDLDLVRRAFGDRSTLSLLRSLLVYEMCSYPIMVKLTPHIIDIAERVPLLSWPVRLAVRETAFRQFCGGETVEDTLPLLMQMKKANVTGILDLSIEADVGQATRNEAEDAAAVARDESDTYWAHNREGQAQRADHVMMLVERGILAAKAAAGTFFAVKCTALASDPEVLERWSEALVLARREFEEMVDGDCAPAATGTDVVIDPPSDPAQTDVDLLRRQLTERTIDEAGFIALAWRYLSAGPPDEDGNRPVASPAMTERQLKTLFRELDCHERGRLDWADYVQLFNSDRLRSGQICLLPDEMDKLSRSSTGTLSATDDMTREHVYRRLHPDTQAELLETLDRLSRLCRAAIAKGEDETSVRLMVDAEQSYLQPAIAYMARQVSSEFNRGRPEPLIYDTYQLYLRRGLGNMVEDLAMAERAGYRWAGKLVRGAYVTAERRYAQENNRVSAVWPTKADTDRSYDRGAELAIRLAGAQTAHVVVATHNHSSVAGAADLMSAIAQDGTEQHQDLCQRIHFAQLLGMGELITARLLTAGYQSAKYVPYGPVQEVVPYLVRRAEENGAMLGSAAATEGAVDPLAPKPIAGAGADEDRRAVLRMVRERLGWRRWAGLREI